MGRLSGWLFLFSQDGPEHVSEGILVLLLLLIGSVVLLATFLPILLLFASQGAKKPSEARAIVASGLAFAQDRSEDPAAQLTRILAGGKQVMQFHLSQLLHVRHHLGMLEVAGDNHRQYQL